MGQTQEREKMTYEGLSNVVYDAFVKDLSDEAEYYNDEERKTRFIRKQMRKNPKERYDQHSFLTIDFSSQKGIYILNAIVDKILPDVYSLELENIGKNLEKFERFLTTNFPDKVEHLIIEEANVHFDNVNLIYLNEMTQRVTSSICLSKFQLKADQFSEFIPKCKHMKRIVLSQCKLSDDSPIEVKEWQFDNLEELEVQQLGLCTGDIGKIGMIVDIFMSIFSRLFH